MTLAFDPEFIKELPRPPARPHDGHKGTFGTVIVIGGYPTMPGAAALCARAAFRTGCGLVKIASDPQTLSIALSVMPSATGLAITGDPASDVRTIDDADPRGRAILAVGPGWGRGGSRAALLELLLQGQRPIVLDADGLHALAELVARRPDAIASLKTRAAPLILTPHPGEFRSLAEIAIVAPNPAADPTDPAQRPAAAAQLAKAFSATVVLKGANTVVGDRTGTRVYLNATGNPALATAGTGDVLTGMIASLLAQGMPAFDAARLGVFVHGRAGDQWTHRNGHAGLLAHDLCDNIPAAISSV